MLADKAVLHQSGNMHGPQLKSPCNLEACPFLSRFSSETPKMSIKYLGKEAISRNSEEEGPLLLPAPSAFYKPRLGDFMLSPKATTGSFPKASSWLQPLTVSPSVPNPEWL